MIVSRVIRLVKHSTTPLHKGLFTFLSLCCLALIVGLYARPFLSDRTMMGNLEPFPDTFHYLVPAFNLARHGSLMMWREGGVASSPAVPPLYSLILTPIFLFQSDPRWFYVINLICITAAAFFLFKTLRVVVKSEAWAVFGIFLFLTNHFVRWIPSLAMSESLLLFLFCYGLWLLSSKLTLQKIALSATLCIAIYATKYAAAPLTLVFAVSFIGRILWQTNFRSYGFRPLITFCLSGAFWGIFFLTWQILFKGTSVLHQLFWQLVAIFPSLQGVLAQTTSPLFQAQTTGASSFFSLSFFTSHWPRYLDSLFGEPGQFLWDKYFLTSSLTGIMAVLGYILLIKKNSTRVLGSIFLALIVAQTAFMSTFYTFDLRYVLTNAPIMIIGATYFGAWLTSQLLRLKRTSPHFQLLEVLVVSLAILSITLVSFSAFKFQIALNLKYQETPWWYLAIKNHDAFFQETSASRQSKPVLISASIPYHYDFFAQSSFELLPLSTHQDFARSEKSAQAHWGENNYENLLALYQKYLDTNKTVYVTNWGLGNEQPLHKDFAEIQNAFSLQIVREGCLGACNLYELKSKTLPKPL